jgi:hypothetical protein
VEEVGIAVSQTSGSSSWRENVAVHFPSYDRLETENRFLRSLPNLPETENRFRLYNDENIKPFPLFSANLAGNGKPFPSVQRRKLKTVSASYDRFSHYS